MAQSFEDQAAAHGSPPGFVPIPFADDFLGHNGLLYVRRMDGGLTACGSWIFRIGPSAPSIEFEQTGPLPRDMA